MRLRQQIHHPGDGGVEGGEDAGDMLVGDDERRLEADDTGIVQRVGGQDALMREGRR